MIRPPIVERGEQLTTLGWIFGTPLVIKGPTWLPLVEAGMWGVMSWVAGQRHPDRSVWQKVFVGLLTMPIAVGSEWCHNIAHAAAAWWVGKPMDAMRIAWGTPLVVYFDIEDPAVTPREHIIRALGGPLFNALALLPILIGRGLTRTTSLARELLDIALASNLFLLLVGMLPIPGIDGGPILKWSLVSRGRTPREADRVVRQVDGVLADWAGRCCLPGNQEEKASGRFPACTARSDVAGVIVLDGSRNKTWDNPESIQYRGRDEENGPVLAACISGLSIGRDLPP